MTLLVIGIIILGLPSFWLSAVMCLAESCEAGLSAARPPVLFFGLLG